MNGRRELDRHLLLASAQEVYQRHGEQGSGRCAEEDREIIFEKFRQAGGAKGDTLTREYAGTGLGLSIVKELSKLRNEMPLQGGVRGRRR